MVKMRSVPLILYLSLVLMIDPPVVPAALKVPAGFRLVGRGLAAGAQIYTCQAPGWVLKAPDATLFDGYGQLMAKHFAGPTWMFKDGSRVAAVKVAGVDAANPKAIEWLLLKTTSAGGEGAYSRVGFIQRVYTAGGLAPESACEAGAEFRSEYTAMYYFWVPAGP